MEFALSEEQDLLQNSLRRALADHVDLARLRAVAAAGQGFAPETERSLLEWGLPGLVVPEEFGGSGLGVLDAALVAQCLGEVAAPQPFIGPAVMATRAIMLCARPEQRAAWLPSIATGHMRPAVALPGLARQRGASQLSLDGDRLSGVLDAVLDAANATHLLVCAGSGEMVMLEIGAQDLKHACEPTIDRTRPLGRFEMRGARGERLHQDVAAARKVLDAGRLLLAADTIGSCATLFQRALDWAGQRVQFGRPIGAFQGVKYMCADMATQLEPCHAMLWHAAHLQDIDSPEAPVLTAHLKAHCDEVARDLARMCVEVHGGMGFTEEAGLHFWVKRIAFNRQMLGGPELCREDAAIAQGWYGVSQARPAMAQEGVQAQGEARL